MERIDRQVLAEHRVLVGTDSPFQAHARLAQAVWREAGGYPVGLHRGTPLGSRLEMPWAEVTLAAYLTPTIRRIVRAEVVEEGRDRQKLFGRPRIFNDLLSSQPLCFNTFGELAANLDLASLVGSRLWPDVIECVERIEFEWSPGRADASYLSNRSAFDVAWFCRDGNGDRTFVGIEVKYHENMRGSAARHQPLYDDLATSSGLFRPEALGSLHKPPLQQLWLDHLLALALGRIDPDLRAVRFVLCAPEANAACLTVGARYSASLADPTAFALLSLDRLVDELTRASVPTASELRQRYLPWTLPEYRPGVPAMAGNPSE